MYLLARKLYEVDIVMINILTILKVSVKLKENFTDGDILIGIPLLIIIVIYCIIKFKEEK